MRTAPYDIVDYMPGWGAKISGKGYKEQQWLPGKARKRHGCANCNQVIRPRNRCYHPATNGHNRSDRLCKNCVEVI